MEKSEQVKTHINNIRKARTSIPKESLTVFDNITAAGDVVSNVLHTVEAIGNLIEYFGENKKGDKK